uniref:Uncharacterized protein n=1 Tax=Oncorhynchus tshawytscha TaxID=74940 RepID=A0AAZ3QT84_ONCTS
MSQTNVQLQEVDVLCFWKFNRKLESCFKVPPKVTFESVGDFSLLLKNIQDGDSGLYDAVVSGNNDRNVFVYLFSERVEPPVLTVDSVSSINGICNVTVTCRGQKTSVTSSCNNSTYLHCPPALCLCGRGSIICNHSNQVSWANDTKEIVELCPLKSGKTHKHTNTHTHK